MTLYKQRKQESIIIQNKIVFCEINPKIEVIVELNNFLLKRHLFYKRSFGKR